MMTKRHYDHDGHKDEDALQVVRGRLRDLNAALGARLAVGNARPDVDADRVAVELAVDEPVPFTVVR